MYTQQELREHFLHGDQDTKIMHSFCKFCQQYFFDQDTLYEHLYKQHETCFLCSTEGTLYQYYQNYQSLENHFRNDHFLCEEAECRERGFVVFKTPMELKIHQANFHAIHVGRHGQIRMNLSAITGSNFSTTTSSLNNTMTESSMRISSQQQQQPIINEENFPALENKSNTATTDSLATSRIKPWIHHSRIGRFSVDDFPSLESKIPEMMKTESKKKSTTNISGDIPQDNIRNNYKLSIPSNNSNTISSYWNNSTEDRKVTKLSQYQPSVAKSMKEKREQDIDEDEPNYLQSSSNFQTLYPSWKLRSNTSSSSSSSSSSSVDLMSPSEMQIYLRQKTPNQETFPERSTKVSNLHIEENFPLLTPLQRSIKKESSKKMQRSMWNQQRLFHTNDKLQRNQQKPL